MLHPIDKAPATLFYLLPKCAKLFLTFWHLQMFPLLDWSPTFPYTSL